MRYRLAVEHLLSFEKLKASYFPEEAIKQQIDEQLHLLKEQGADFTTLHMEIKPKTFKDGFEALEFYSWTVEEDTDDRRVWNLKEGWGF